MKHALIRYANSLLLALLMIPSAFAADRGEIQSGETKTGINLTGPSYMDTWNFTGNAGDRILINAVTIGGSLNTSLVLYPPNGGPAETVSGTSDRLDWRLKATGLYTIEINDYGLDDAGTYNLTFVKLPGALTSAADPDGGPIASGQTLSGTINAASDSDFFQFYGNAGDRVLINAVTTSGSLNTSLGLYPPNGGPTETVSGTSDRLDWQLKTTGLYTIEINDYGLDDAGTYNLTFVKLPGALTSAADPDGGPIASGQTLSGTINAASDSDFFQFYGNAGDRVLINAVTTTGSLNTSLGLYPPGGGPYEFASGTSDRLDWQLKATGLYTIEVNDYGLNDAGKYNLTFVKLPGTLTSAADPDGGPIASGQTLSGAINAASDSDFFQFYGNAGDRVLINAVTTTGSLNTSLGLYPPGGGPYEVASGTGDRLDWQLKATGLYTIEVNDYGLNDAGAYNISMSKIPSTERPGLYNPCPTVGWTIGPSLANLQCDPVAGATGYDLYFGEGVVDALAKVASNLQTPVFPLPAVQTGRKYTWHVVAHTATGDIQGPYWWFLAGVPRIEFLPLVRLPDGRVQLTIQGRVSEPVELQASSNLAQWKTLTTINNLSCAYTFIDNEAASLNARLYRAVVKH